MLDMSNVKFKMALNMKALQELLELNVLVTLTLQSSLNLTWVVIAELARTCD